MEYKKRLADSFLAQMSYEKKYVIMNDNVLYDRFLLAGNDFVQCVEEAISTADTKETKDLLIRLKEYHGKYQSLVDEEVKLIRANKGYYQDRYKEEREKTVNTVMEEFKNMGVYSQQSIYGKVKKLEEAGADARKVAVAAIIASLISGIAISIFITRGITRPLSKMMGKIKEVSNGAFNGDLNLSSSPEIAGLANAFNSMCNKLKTVDKMKSDFFLSMSHELRTPLTSIKEGTNLLLEGIGGEVQEKQKRLLSIIAEESNRLIDLVNSLLDLSRMDAGMMEYRFDKADIIPLIHKAVMEIEPLAMAKGIDLEIGAVNDLPSVKMDSERMLQVLRNLIGNAVKFTPQKGRVKISSRIIGENLEVSVIDTGPGIPEEDLATVFEKFYQASHTGSYKIKGTGLGLAIVKHIIAAHGGRIWVESEQGLGSSFIFALPV
jgi:two-component system sensor histidine kinase GlrK